jgi:hypothetical protein
MRHHGMRAGHHAPRHRAAATHGARTRPSGEKGGHEKNCYDYAWQSEAMKNCLNHHEGGAEESHHAMHHAARHHHMAHHAAMHRHRRSMGGNDEPADSSGGTNTGATPMPNAGPAAGSGNQPGNQ